MLALLSLLVATSAHASPSDSRAAVEAAAAAESAVSTLRAETVRKSAYIDDRKAVFAALERSEPLAAVLSTVVGFGSGSFYAGNNVTGAAFAVGEAALIAAALITGGSTGTTLGLVLLGMRGADAIVATLDTVGYNEELNRRMQIGTVQLGWTGRF